MRLALSCLSVLLPVGPLAGQAVPRADLPRAGALRVTFDPVIAFWDQEFFNGARRPLGAFLSGDSVGGAQIPQLARLDQDIGIAAGAPGFVANLGAALLALRAERRVTPLLLEFGLSDRLSLGVRVPLVRVQTRAGFSLDSANGNLGRNPRSNLPAADSTYGAFFSGFDAALATMDQNIASGVYGAPGSPQRAAAQAFADSARDVRAALRRSAYGAGPGDAAPLLPTSASLGGVAIGINVDRIQQQLAVTWGVTGFTVDFLLPSARATATDINALLGDSIGYGAAFVRDTRRGLRFWLGDVELGARFRIARGTHYAATVGGLVRLPTGHPDSPHDLVDLSAGDGQLDIEGELTQELTAGRLWLNAAVRAGVQTVGERARRVAPGSVILVPRGATALLNWNPGNYVQVDVAPLYRFAPQFAAGVTLGWSAQSEDRYSYRGAQDSLAVATSLGAPVAASVLDAGTGLRRARVGGALTYAGPVVEGSLVVERVVSGRGGTAPALTSFRIVLRTRYRLF